MFFLEKNPHKIYMKKAVNSSHHRKRVFKDKKKIYISWKFNNFNQYFVNRYVQQRELHYYLKKVFKDIINTNKLYFLGKSLNLSVNLVKIYMKEVV